MLNFKDPDSDVKYRYFETSEGFIAVYSIEDLCSLLQLSKHIEMAFSSREMYKTPLIVVGN